MFTFAAASLATPPSDLSAGGRLVAADGTALPLVGTALTASAAGGLCRVRLEQRFRNPHAEPLRVSYLFPLPHHGAVSGFAFRLGDRRVVGEVDRLAAARERFERALVEGHTAGLVEQVRGSVFSQELGNLPPGAELVAELTIDQRLDWLPEGAWAWRFPTALTPRYQGAEGRVADAGRLQVEVAEGGLPPRLTLSLEVADPLCEGGRLASTTHALRVDAAGGGWRASLQAEDGAPLDRDLAIQWPAAAGEVGAALRAAGAPAGSRLAGRAFGLLTVVPPRPEALRAVPRDLVVLLDTSGSMEGAPLDQAREVISALVESLGDEDRLELIELSDAARRWKAAPVAATRRARREALGWLAGLEAGGSTEMGQALLEALAPLREGAQRQVILVTDGAIGFEQEIMRTVLTRLPAASRLHAVAVGDAANRSLTGPAARAGRGVEVVVGLDEPAGVAAARLLARTVAPVVTGLAVSGSALLSGPARPPDLFAGAPALLPVELDPRGGTLTVRGRSADGPFERTLTVAAAEASEAGAPLSALFAREAVEELELEASQGFDRARLDAAIERLGLDFQVSTRRTSWIAVSSEATVDPRQPTRRQVVPQALPHGVSVAGLGLRRGGVVTKVFASMGEALPSASATTSTLYALADEHIDLSQDDSEDGEAPDEFAGGSFPAGGPPPPPPGWERAPSPPPARKRQVLRPSPTPSTSGGSHDEGARMAAAAPRTLPARVVLADRERLVLEFEVTGAPLAWDPSAFERLVAAAPVDCVVDLAASTAAGEVAPGQVIRLVLRLAPSALPALLRRAMPARPGAVRFAGGLTLRLDLPGSAPTP